MSKITYETIEPLIDNTYIKGQHVYVVFKCPVSGERVESRAKGKK